MTEQVRKDRVLEAAGVWVAAIQGMRDQVSGEKAETKAAAMPEMGADPEGAWAAVMAEVRDAAAEKDPADVGNPV